MKRYKLTDIVWDTEDGDELPGAVSVKAFDPSDAIDVASDRFGTCIVSACVEEESDPL